jgi:LysR family glycine cleavage system transcriptional activator
MQMKLKLPPLQALRHFECAARLGSFKAAAEELNVTQGAVSQQIRELEQYFGKKLFVRQLRKVALTTEGRELSDVDSSSFSDISAICRQISYGDEDGGIRIELGTFFSSRWLSPRIGEFIRLHPSIQPQLVHRIHVLSNEADVDIAIQYGTGKWRSFESHKLMNLHFQPVAKPEVAAAIKQAASWPSESMPLIHARSRSDWELWLETAGLPVDWASSGIVFDDTNVALEAAASGAGIALGFFPLIDEDIRSGRLAIVSPHSVQSPLAYYALVRPASKSIRSVRKFLTWLTEVCTDGTE